MSRNRARNEDSAKPRDDRSVEQPQTDDTEGHMFINMDPGASRTIAKGRSAEIERELRERQRQKEARPNRR